MASLSVDEAIKKLLGVSPAVLERLFRDREIASRNIVEPPFALRLDGVRFGNKLRHLGIRSKKVHEALIRAGIEICKELNCECAYIVSDEINVICLRSPFYSARHEKLVSISASIAGAVLSRAMEIDLFFDSRVIKFYDRSEIMQYILYRARVGFNNYVSQLYHAVFKDKHTPGIRMMLRMLNEKNVSLGEPWMFLGSSVSRQMIEKKVLIEGVERIKHVWRYVVSEGFEEAIKCVERFI